MVKWHKGSHLLTFFVAITSFISPWCLKTSFDKLKSNFKLFWLETYLYLICFAPLTYLRDGHVTIAPKTIQMLLLGMCTGSKSVLSSKWRYKEETSSMQTFSDGSLLTNSGSTLERAFCDFCRVLIAQNRK